MMEIEEFESKLLERVREKLCGHVDLKLNQMHFEYLQNKTGISIRKLKELFGFYKKRSSKSYDYILNQLSQFIGFSDWNSFVRNELLKSFHNSSKDSNLDEPIQVKRRVELDLNKDHNIVISVFVRGK